MKIMVWLVLAFVCSVLSYCTVHVAGQCIVSSCAFAALGSEESFQVSIEEHDHRLETMNQNMCSAFEKLEAAVNRTNARGQEELFQDLKTLYFNMSVNLEKVSEKIPVRAECPAMQEQEEFFNSMNLSLAAMILRTDEHVQTVNENLTYIYQNLSSKLQTVNRIWDERFQVMQQQHQNISLRIDKIDERFEDLRTADDRLLKAAKGHDEILERMHRNLSNGLQTANESLVRVLDEKLHLVNEQLSAGLALMNGSVFGAWKEYDQKLQTMNETLSSSIDQINEKLNAIYTVLGHVNETLQYARFQDYCHNTSVVCDCSDIKANGYRTSGVYRIYVVDQGQRYYANASCDMTTTNGGWTVFQRRQDGSVDFYREWNDYEHGFGNPNGEFWLGNNFLHLLTSKRGYRLRIDLEDFEGGNRYAEYSTFSISSSTDKYRLSKGTYSGTAEESLSYHNNQRFSTKDSDNDADSSRNCAVTYGGAWWYNACHHSNLNGLYLRGRYSSNGSFNGNEGIQWHPYYWVFYSLKTTEMKISSS